MCLQHLKNQFLLTKKIEKMTVKMAYSKTIQNTTMEQKQIKDLLVFMLQNSTPITKPGIEHLIRLYRASDFETRKEIYKLLKSLQNPISPNPSDSLMNIYVPVPANNFI